ncbi:hypothetical protein ASL20_21010 [Cupriavidus necator]|uniref:UTRA domain-containing protein n=1 Tax=Cupriavidus TaxID=106589 RepID=UPI000331085F|nr:MULTISPECIES: UTRA domain-containing protein [Cupriavidus]EON20796.1 acyltransferase [Cupriavidus sp. GA3-3]KUE86967.1 hypothetical protein ASL20_21010 [Cupriavidus necator]
MRAVAVSDRHVADALRLEPGAAAPKIVRRYMDAAGETFEVSVTVHPADSFSVSMRLQRSSG